VHILVLHSFPTRRSSDLGIDLKGNRLFLTAEDHHSVEVFNLKSNIRIHSIGGLDEPHNVRYLPDSNKLLVVDGGAGEVKFLKGRSEEHTSELQSRFDLVC